MSPASAAEFTQWKIQPAATALVTSRLDELCTANRWLGRLAERLLCETGTRLLDWVDTIHVAKDADLNDSGFIDTDPYQVAERWHHPGALLPWVIADGSSRVVLRVDSVVDFLRAQSILRSAADDETVDVNTAVIGDATASRRSAIVSNSGGVEVVVLERHGDQGPAIGSTDRSNVSLEELQRAAERLRLRKRDYADPVEGIEATIVIVRELIELLGVDRTCDLFFQTEREFWQLRNDAAELQYRAQALLGFGWANHDHHTYRSGRASFAPLIRLLETLGMHCRERFYAGADAGWGAQVLEQPVARIVVFADVDMSADEVLGDFAHEGLGPTDHRGTVGLWCHLHGEAVLQAGMHHLECQFAFEAARQLLANKGADSLQPFSNFEYLRQSFTRGQIWPVQEANIQSALAHGWINEEQAARFRRDGVTGSHLEVLERNDGYKGFNQTGISDIIARTDPRNMQMH